MAAALKPASPLVFTYHHNAIEAYFPVAVALLDAGLVCSASLPCPAEMGGSIHINGTDSSVVDTVFVCRTTGTVKRRLLAETPEEIAVLVAHDLELLRQGGVRVTRGDARCVAYGHLIRLAIWRLRHRWDRSVSWSVKLARIGEAVTTLGGFSGVEKHLSEDVLKASRKAGLVREERASYFGDADDEVPF